MSLRPDSKKLHLVILAGTSILCSKLFFVFISRDDSEGSNLLIVAGLAAALYALALVARSSLRLSGTRGLLAVISIQAIVVTVLYFALV